MPRESVLEERLERLMALSAALAAQKGALVDLLIKFVGIARRSAEGEVDLAVRTLCRYDEIAGNLRGREPLGKAAIMLPANSWIIVPLTAIPSAFLAGNRVEAKFPSGAEALAGAIGALLSDFLPQVSVSWEEGPRFITRHLQDPETAVLLVYGDDHWVADYAEQVRTSGKKFMFEGPGKDPFIVLANADVELAAQDAVKASYANAGQMCTSPERFYVHQSHFREFLAMVLDLTGKVKVGQPADPQMEVGVIRSPWVAERIKEQWKDALNKGATLHCGGRVEELVDDLGQQSFLVWPTVISGVDHNMLVMRDETFGPVIPIRAFHTEEEVRQLANDSRYGLCASVYGRSKDLVEQLRLTHGLVTENYVFNLRPDFLGETGGYKNSAWVWEWRDRFFIRREGPHHLWAEFCRPS